MDFPPLNATSGIASLSKALVQALGIPYLRAIGLAMDGSLISTSGEDFFDGFSSIVRSAEMLLESLGYRLVAIRQGELPELDRLGIEPQLYRAAMGTFPREIPLTSVSPERIRAEYQSLAGKRAPRYADPSRISMRQLAQTVTGIVRMAPRSFGNRIVNHLSEAFPVIVAAQDGLRKSHLPLISGCSTSALPTLAQGEVHEGLERHCRFYRHLGVCIRITGPGGDITIRPMIKPLSRVLVQIEDFTGRQQQSSRATEDRSRGQTSTPSRKSSRKSGGSLSVDEIVAKLKKGIPPLTIASEARVSHQYIYKIARDAGLGRRQSSVIFAQDALRKLFPEP